jgi:hypothetical protein
MDNQVETQREAVPVPRPVGELGGGDQVAGAGPQVGT